MTIEELLEKAYQLYPVSPSGFSDGDLVDGNLDLRNGYIRGYQDALKEIEEKK
jgi:hypothetical protein